MEFLKLTSLILLICGGFVGFLADQPYASVGGAMLIVLSVIFYILAKILGWCFHG